jgi:hypothetical protein
MMRLSSSVRLTWSDEPGPSTGGTDALPLGFLPVAAALAARAAILASYSACSRACRSFARASMTARALAISARRCSRRASSSDRQTIRQVDPIRSFGRGQQLGHLGPQLRLDLARMRKGQRAVAARIGMDLGAIQRHRPHLQHAHLARQQQHLHKQRLDLRQKAPPERGDGVVVR